MEYWSFIQKNLHFNFNLSYTYLLYLHKSAITQICFSFSPFFLNFLFILHANTNSLSLSLSVVSSTSHPSLHSSEEVRSPLRSPQFWHTKLRHDQASLPCIMTEQGIPTRGNGHQKVSSCIQERPGPTGGPGNRSSHITATFLQRVMFGPTRVPQLSVQSSFF